MSDDITGKELAERPAGELVDFATPEDFLQDYDENADNQVTSIPRLKIEQKDPGTMGKLVCEAMGEVLDKMTFLMIKSSDSKIYFESPYVKGSDPLCKSIDGIIPVKNKDFPTPFAEKCEDCQKNKWSTDSKGNVVKPECSDVKDILLVTFSDTNSMIPMWYSAMRTCLPPARKKLLEPLKLRRIALSANRKRAGLPPAHECMFKFDMETELSQKTDSYLPVFKNIQELNEQEKQGAVALAMAYHNFTAHHLPIDEDELENDGQNGTSDKEEF